MDKKTDRQTGRQKETELERQIEREKVVNKLGKSVFFPSSIVYNNDHYCTFIACHYNMRFGAVSWFPVVVRVKNDYVHISDYYISIHAVTPTDKYTHLSLHHRHTHIFIYFCMRVCVLRVCVSVPVRERARACVCVCKYFKNCLIFDTSL